MTAGTSHDGRSVNPRSAGLRATVGLRAGTGGTVAPEVVEVEVPAAAASASAGSQTPLVMAVHVGFAGDPVDEELEAGGLVAVGLAADGSYRGAGAGGS